MVVVAIEMGIQPFNDGAWQELIPNGTWPSLLPKNEDNIESDLFTE